MILESQISTLLEFEETIIDEIRSSISNNNNNNNNSSSSEGGSGGGGGNRRVTEAATGEIRKRSREQVRRIVSTKKSVNILAFSFCYRTLLQYMMKDWILTCFYHKGVPAARPSANGRAGGGPVHELAGLARPQTEAL